MPNEYTLFNKDTPLVKFSIADVGDNLFRKEKCSPTILEVYNNSPYSDVAGLTSVLEGRKPALNRAYMVELLKEAGFETLSGLLDITFGVSMHDTLWIRSSRWGRAVAGRELNRWTWKDVNPYTNSFVLRDSLAFRGGDRDVCLLRSPEPTTDGALPKCWRRYRGEMYLMKGGTSGAYNAGNEPYCEYYATQVLEALGYSEDRYVKYELIRNNDEMISKCLMFTSEEYGFASFASRYAVDTFDDIFNIMDELGLRQKFNDIMVFDALVYNTDRHLGNFGFLVNNDTFDILDLAPIFDNGFGLLPFYTMDKDIFEYAAEHDFHSCGLSYADIVPRCIEERHKVALQNMLHFKFQKHQRFNWKSERLECVESLLRMRAEWLLGILKEG